MTSISVFKTFPPHYVLPTLELLRTVVGKEMLKNAHRYAYSMFV